MAIELSNLTFNDEDDIVPSFGVEQILNTGVANTLAGNDTIIGTGDTYKLFYPEGVGILNFGTFNTAEGNDLITGTGSLRGIDNSGTLNTADGNDTITGGGFHGIDNYGTLNTAEGMEAFITTAVALILVMVTTTSLLMEAFSQA